MAATERPVAYGITNTLVMGLGARFTDIVDGAGTDYADAATPLDVKVAHRSWSDDEPDKLDERSPRPEEAALRIDFCLVGSDALVDVFIEYDPGSTIHRDFYESRHDESQESPRIATLATELPARMGLNRLYWSGRDSTAERRILLAGRYTLRLVARAGRVVRRASSTLEIAPPHSWSFGMDVLTDEGEWQRTADAMRETGETLRSLVDGSGYSGNASSANTGASALARWADSSVAVFDGHGGPAGMQFHAREGQLRLERNVSYLALHSSGSLSPGTDALSNWPSDVFKDMLVAVLCGCRTGDNVVMVHRLIQSLRQMMNVPEHGRLDERTTTGLRAFQIARGLPMTALPDAATADGLGVPLSGDEPTAAELRDMQRALRQWSRYITFNWETDHTESEADRTEAYTEEFRRFQELAWLPQTGLADAATKERLRMAGERPVIGENIAEEFMRRGCHLALGFPEYTFFGSAETWLTAFARALAGGATIGDARAEATQSVSGELQATLRFRAYSHDPDWSRMRVVPARYGAPQS
ncbi:MAG: hypothetical protein KC668_18535 [Myxococcales bacterium]|nr:hypothetical protein [Myxococcales bacterium]